MSIIKVPLVSSRGTFYGMKSGLPGYRLLIPKQKNGKPLPGKEFLTDPVLFYARIPRSRRFSKEISGTASELRTRFPAA